MATYPLLAVLCLAGLTCVVEANLDLGKIWEDLSKSDTVENEAVKEMVADEIMKLRPPFLLRGAPMAMQIPKLTKTSVAGNFQWSSCGPANQSIDIRNLTIGPSPLHFPGELDFGFDIIFHDTIGSGPKVSADLELQINTEGTWIKIPCIGSIGSCHYDDLCSIMKQIQCPADLKEQGIPCNCPFNKGEYKLKKYSVTVLASVFISGDYQAKAVVTNANNQQLGCYKISFTVE